MSHNIPEILTTANHLHLGMEQSSVDSHTVTGWMLHWTQTPTHTHTQVCAHIYVDAHHSHTWGLLLNHSTHCSPRPQNDQQICFTDPWRGYVRPYHHPQTTEGNTENKGTPPNSGCALGCPPWYLSTKGQQRMYTKGPKPGSHPWSVTDLLYSP